MLRVSDLRLTTFIQPPPFFASPHVQSFTPTALQGYPWILTTPGLSFPWCGFLGLAWVVDVSITDVISLFDIPQYGLLKKTYCMFCSLILTAKAFHPEFYQTLWLVSIHYNDTTKQLLNVSLHVHCKYIQTCAVWPDSVSTRSSLFQMYIWKVPL